MGGESGVCVCGGGGNVSTANQLSSLNSLSAVDREATTGNYVHYGGGGSSRLYSESTVSVKLHTNYIPQCIYRF